MSGLSGEKIQFLKQKLNKKYIKIISQDDTNHSKHESTANDTESETLLTCPYQLEVQAHPSWSRDPICARYLVQERNTSYEYTGTLWLRGPNGLLYRKIISQITMQVSPSYNYI